MNGAVRNILDAGGRLFSEYGVAATTVRQIADEAQMSLGGIYHHFSSKEAIASELISRFVGSLEDEYARLARSEGSFQDRIAELVVLSLRISADHPWATETYFREATNLVALPDHENISRAVRRNEMLWLELTTAGVAAGEFRDDVDVAAFTRLLSESVWLTVRLHRPVLAERYELLADELLKLLVEGYRADGATRRRDG